MDRDELALGVALDTLEGEDRAEGERLLGRDPAFVAAVDRAHTDIRAIEVGLAAMAGGAIRRPPRRRIAVPLGAAAVAALLVAGGIAVIGSGDATAPPPPATLGGGLPDAGDLDALVSTSSAIVIGRVSDVVSGGDDGELAWAIATIEVAEVLKGDVSGSVFAFDYVYTAVPWTVTGEELLLFLSDATGTANEAIEPAPHLQVTHGAANGALAVRNGELANAPFTMQQVRDALR